MRTFISYFIAGILFTGFGYLNCPGPISGFTPRNYALNIILWPIAIIEMIDRPELTCH